MKQLKSLISIFLGILCFMLIFIPNLYATETETANNKTGNINEEIFQEYINVNIDDTISFLKKDAYIYNFSEKHKILFLNQSLKKIEKTKIIQQIKTDFEVLLQSIESENYETGRYIKEKYLEYIKYLELEPDISYKTVTFLEHLMQNKDYNEWATYLGAYKTDILELFLNTYVFNNKVQNILAGTIENKNSENIDAVVKELQDISNKNGFSVGQLSEAIVNYYGVRINEGMTAEFKGFDDYFYIEKLNFDIANEIYSLLLKMKEYNSFKQLYKEFFILSSFEIFINTDIKIIESYISSMSTYKLTYPINIDMKEKFYSLLVDRIKCYNGEIDEDILKMKYDSFLTETKNTTLYFKTVENVYGNSQKSYTEDFLKQYETTINNKYSYVKQNTSIVSFESVEKTVDSNSYHNIPVKEKSNFNFSLFIIVGIIIIIIILIIIFCIYKINKEKHSNNEYYY